MCGIFGYLGKNIQLSALIDGLQRLEYRGYDSCGIAGVSGAEFFVKKRAGKIVQLKEELNSRLQDKFSSAILHSRWATHGRPNQTNSHPHLDCCQQIAVVHNGIIENYLTLKEQLQKEGHKFASETDTEVVVHLIEKFYRHLPLEVAVFKTITLLEGSFALAVISQKEPDKLIGVRKGSPLIIGWAKDAFLLASDIPAILPFTRKVIYVKDEEVVVVHNNTIKMFNFKGKPVTLRTEISKLKAQDAEKKGYEHFMLKEIFEQPEVLRKTAASYIKRGKIVLPEMKIASGLLKKAKRLYITACGTAYHAGYVAKYFLEKYCQIDVIIDTSSEFRYRNLNLKKNELMIAISQSGETADTLAAVRAAKERGVKVISICNVLGSSLVKDSDSLILTYAGPEIGVASTKAYTAQVFSLFLFALYLANEKKTITLKEYSQVLGELQNISGYQEEILKNREESARIAGKFSRVGCFLFLGRGINFPSALEGALKLKEISYIPAEGYPAGEMKHGPIALIDEYRGVVCIAPQDNLYEKMVSNMQEIKARQGKILGILNHGDKEAALLSDEVMYIPRLKNQDLSPLLAAVCLQLFAYYVARNLGHGIDQPRNLAKSVTVE